MEEKTKLTEKQVKDVKAFFDNQKAYNRTIRMLSDAIRKEETSLWEYLHFHYPELANGHYILEDAKTLVKIPEPPKK